MWYLHGGDARMQSYLSSSMSRTLIWNRGLHGSALHAILRCVCCTVSLQLNKINFDKNEVVRALYISKSFII